MVDRPVFLSQHLFHRGIFSSVELKRVEKILLANSANSNSPNFGQQKNRNSNLCVQQSCLGVLTVFFCCKYGVPSGTVSWKQNIGFFVRILLKNSWIVKLANDTLWRIISGWLRIHIKHLETMAMAMAGPTPQRGHLPPPKKRPYDQGLSTNGFPQ